MSDIQHEIESGASASAAYDALTTAAGLQGWWAKDCDVGHGVGDEHELRFVKQDRLVAMRFRVEVLEPGARVRWSCIENGNPIWVGSTLEWTLEEGKDGVKLRFVHGGLAAADGPPYAMTMEGWSHFMASLQRYLDTGTGEPW